MKNVKNLSVLFILTLITSSLHAQGGRDLTGTTVNANAFRFEGDNHTTVRLSVDIVSPDLNYADGVRFDFGSSNTILDAFVETDMGIDPAVMIQGGEVVFGDSSDGIFNGDGIFIYGMSYDFVVHLDGQVASPLDIEFIVYDDGWAQDYCINDNNCELCNDYGWGVDCDGNYLTVALNAEGVVTIENIEILAAPNQNPNITNLIDIDNDQGKQMMLSWVPGDLIDLPYFTQFSLYRYSPHPSDYSFEGNSVIDVTVSELGSWDYLNTVPWVGHEPYASLVNTLEDNNPTAFKVVAQTEDPNLNFHSDHITGRSYDNIAPPAPNGLIASVNNNIVSLSWNPVDVTDFNYYSIHRAQDSLFQLDMNNFIGYSATNSYTDESAPFNAPLYYKISAVDIGGNLSFGSS